MVTKEVNILAGAKPKTIKLGDGKDYTLPPSDLTTLANVEESLGFGMSQMQERMQAKTVITIRAVLCALLKETYPEMTAEQLGRLIPLAELPNVMKLVGDYFSEANI